MRTNREGKGGKYLEKKYIFLRRRKIQKGKRKKMFVEANYFCERDKNGEGIGGNSRKKLLPKRDDEQNNSKIDPQMR